MNKQIYSAQQPQEVSFSFPANYSGSVSVIDQFYRRSNGFGKSFTKVNEEDFDPNAKDSVVLVAMELDNKEVIIVQLGILANAKNVIGFNDSIEIDTNDNTWAFKPNVNLTVSGKTAKFAA